MNTGPVIRLSNALAEVIDAENLERLAPSDLVELEELIGMGFDAIRRRQRALERDGWTRYGTERDAPIITEAELRLLDGNR